MKVRRNRKIEREAVNVTRALFEGCNYIFQEVDLGNDYGKDVYVDVTEGEAVTGLCIALQIKGGNSYRRPGGYGIPLDDGHVRVWRQSSVPIAGIVYDPKDRKLRWCNISGFLQNTSNSLPSYIPVPASVVLTAETLEQDFKCAFSAHHTQRMVGPALLNLTSGDPDTQVGAMRDCFILGRSDPRVLILIRHLLHLFAGESLRMAVVVLAHATPHGDIGWHKGNWIPDDARRKICLQMRWTTEEIQKLLQAANWNEWQRGDQGQHVYSLLHADPEIKKKINDAAIEAVRQGNEDVAFAAMFLAIYWAGREGVQMFEGFLAYDRRFGKLPLSPELRAILQEHGCVMLFE